MSASVTSGFTEATFEDDEFAVTAEDLGEPTVEPAVTLKITIAPDPDADSDTAYEPPVITDLFEDVSVGIEAATGEAVSVSDLQSAVTNIDCRGSFSACNAACERVFRIDVQAEGAGAACEWEDQFVTARGCTSGEGACVVGSSLPAT